MPEIKNNFTQGRMNKDLDEKLIPKGQYIHAVNAQISRAGNSGDGVLGAIKGITALGGGMPNSICIGSISDEANNKLYFLTTATGVSNDADCIFEYDQSTNTITTVFRDVNDNVLNFPDDFITAINVIDDFLFWTDGYGEPKKISISRSIEGTNQAAGHTQLVVDGISLGDVIHDHVTVIKKKPESAPTIKINTSIQDYNTTDSSGNTIIIQKSVNPIFEKIFPRFAVRYKYADGEYSAIGPFTDVIFNAKFSENRDADSSFSFFEPYHLTMVNAISSLDICNFVPTNIPLDVVQVDLLYMQENSSVVYSIDSIKKIDPEWSAAGVAQNDYNAIYSGSIGTFDANVNSTGRYELSTENIYAALPENQLLRNYDNVPRLAKAQEITGNRIVYGNYTQNYDIIDSFSQEYTPKLSANYNERYNSIDTFLEGGLRSIKSQRDYQVGVVFGDRYGRETPVFTSDQSFVNIPWEGSYGLNASNSLILESNISNEAPSWASYYKFFVKNTAGEYYNLVMDKAYDPPTQTDFENEDDHIWISFASTDRNKLTIDDYIILKKVFDSGFTTSGGQMPIENRFKILDIKNNVPDSISYKYYNLGIASNSPGNPLGPVGNPNVTNTTVLTTYFPDNNKKVDIAGTDTIIIDRTSHVQSFFGGQLLEQAEGSQKTENLKNLYISWKAKHPETSSVFKHSKRYRVSNITDPQGNLVDEYHLKLSEPISEEDSLIARPSTAQTVQTSSPAPAPALNETLEVRIDRKERRDYENFSGKFFVKIHGNNLIKDRVFSTTPGLEPDEFISAQFNLLSLADVVNVNTDMVDSNLIPQGAVNSNGVGQLTSDNVDGAVSAVGTPQQINSTEFPTTIGTYHSGNNLTVTQQDWESVAEAVNVSGFGFSNPNLGFFFVDQMGFVASNPSSTNYAKESGQGWRGNEVNYPKQVWRVTAIENGSFAYNYPSSATSITGDPDYGPSLEGEAVSTIPHPNNPGAVITFNSNSTYGAGQPSGSPGPIDITNGTIGTAVHTSSLPNSNYNINSIEGAITTSAAHVSNSVMGYRKWRDNSLYENTYGNDYGTNTGKNVIHISFFAPGQDLHDGNLNPNNHSHLYFRGSGTDTNNYNDIISAQLQGIWGGGWFTNPDGSKLGSSDEGFICFEGNWGPKNTHTWISGGSDMCGHWQAPSPQHQGDAGNQGYNLSFQTKHEDQWNPTKTAFAGVNAKAEDFLSNMIPGNKFRFKDDPNKKVYTIQSRKEKHLYNHTPWRKRLVWDGNNYVGAGDSVEEAALIWANTGTGGGYWAGNPGFFNVSFPSDFGKAATNTNAFVTLQSAIARFGSANNRRVCYIIELDEDITTGSTGSSSFNPFSTGVPETMDINSFQNIEFISDNPQVVTGEINENPAIWETEPSQNEELNIYHEVSNNIPLRIDIDNIEQFAPLGCRVSIPNVSSANPGFELYVSNYLISSNQVVVRVTDVDFNDVGFNFLTLADYADQEIRFYRDDGSYTTAIIDGTWLDSTWDNQVPPYWAGLGYRPLFRLKTDIDPTKNMGLSFYNTFSFGDGVESSRIRAGFNEMRITNGPKASATLEQPYQEEERKNGLIYSGIYNSTSGVNNLNQFISAEKITKDINPTYGGITKLFSRKTDLITLCEDRILKILANKDAVFNADGNPQLVASENVLGQAVPYAGDYGCQNPESVDFDNYRIYFADKQRKSVLRLSMDGLTPISDAGMRSWFQENLVGNFVLGTYDNDEEEYNLTIGDQNLINLSTDYIENSYFNYGDESYSVETTPDFTEDGATQNGDNLYYDQALGVQETLDLSAEVIVINWPLIPAGSIFSSITPITQNFSPAQFNDNISNSTGDYLDFNIYSAYDESVRNTSFTHVPLGSFNSNEITTSVEVYDPSNSDFTDHCGSPFNGSVGHGTPVAQLKRQITWDGTTHFLNADNSAGFHYYGGSGVNPDNGINGLPIGGGYIGDYGLYANTTAINRRCADSESDMLDDNPSKMQDVITLNNGTKVHKMMKPNLFWDFGEVDNSGDYAANQGIIFQGYRDCEIHLTLPGTQLYGGSVYPRQKRRNLTAAIRDWHTQTNSTPSANSSGYYNLNNVSYATANNNTIFAGEIVEIEFEFGYPDFINKEQFDQEPNIKIELYDGQPMAGGTLVDASNIHGLDITTSGNYFTFYDNMAGVVGSMTQVESMFNLQPGGAALNTQITPDSDTYYQSIPTMGQSTWDLTGQGGSNTTFNGIDSSNFSNPSSYRKVYKITVPFFNSLSQSGIPIVDTSNLGEVLVQDLQVRITVDGTDFEQDYNGVDPVPGSQMSSTLILGNFRMRKLYQMTRPAVPEYIIIGQPDFPEQDIPAWTQVSPIQGNQIYSSNGDLATMEYPAYGDQNKWTDVSNPGLGFKKVWQGIGMNAYSAHISEYGEFNYPDILTGVDANNVTHTIFVGESNGQTIPGSYSTPNVIIPQTSGPIGYGGNNIASTLSSNAPSPTYSIDPATITTKIEIGTFESDPSLKYPLNTALVQNNWYAVRATTTNTPAAFSGNHLFILRDIINANVGSFPQNTFRNHTQLNNNYPDWHYGTIPSINHVDFDPGDIGLLPSPNLNAPNGPMTRWMTIFKYDGVGTPGVLQLLNGYGTLAGETIETIEVRNLTTYNAGGGDATNWVHDNQPTSFADIPGQIDFLLANTNPVIVTWPFGTYYYNNKLCWRSTAQYEDWQQEFGSAQNSSSAPQNPSIGGYSFRFTVSANPHTNQVAGNLIVSVANALGDFDPIAGECAGVRLTGIDQVGDYEIIFNFDDSHTPQVFRDSIDITSTANVDTVHGAGFQTNTAIENRIRFVSGLNGAEMAVTNVVIEDLTIAFGGGSATSWNFTGFNNVLQNYITWNNNVGAIGLSNLPYPVPVDPIHNPNGDPYQIEQVIAPEMIIDNSKTYFFEADINIVARDNNNNIVPFTSFTNGVGTNSNEVYPELTFYYYNSAGEGFHFHPGHDSNLSVMGHQPWWLPNGTTGYNYSSSITSNLISSLGYKVRIPFDWFNTTLSGYTGATLMQPHGINFSNNILVPNPSPLNPLIQTNQCGPLLQNTFVIVLNGVANMPTESYTISGSIDNVRLRSFDTFDDSNFKTLSYKEQQKGWVSFKDFYPENGLSLGSKYYTFKESNLYKHHDTVVWNQFYGGTQYETLVRLVFNDSASICKEFHSINFEGSIGFNNFSDGNTNATDFAADGFITANSHFSQVLSESAGWQVDGTIVTDMEQGTARDFDKKENKWYSDITGMKDPIFYQTDKTNIQGNDINNSFGIGIVESAFEDDGTNSNAPADPNADAQDQEAESQENESLENIPPPQQNVPQQNVPQQNVPKQNVPKQNVPKQNTLPPSSPTPYTPPSSGGGSSGGGY